jgi:hypothetical protein
MAKERTWVSVWVNTKVLINPAAVSTGSSVSHEATACVRLALFVLLLHYPAGRLNQCSIPICMFAMPFRMQHSSIRCNSKLFHFKRMYIMVNVKCMMLMVTGLPVIMPLSIHIRVL